MLFESMAHQLERSEIPFEFLAIIRSAPILPLALSPAQHLLVRAAIELIPHWLRTKVRLKGQGVNAWEASVVRQLGAQAHDSATRKRSRGARTIGTGVASKDNLTICFG